MTSDLFQKVLLPALDTLVVIMDKATFHRRSRLEVLCKEQGHRLLPLPLYSPEYHFIKETRAHIKNTSEKYCQSDIVLLHLT